MKKSFGDKYAVYNLRDKWMPLMPWQQVRTETRETAMLKTFV
jgi:hypothetical protein